MKSKFSCFFCCLVISVICASSAIKAQTYEAETGFKYVKAEYFLKTSRFEDAIKELGEIIKENSNYKDVLFLRADTRFKIANYKMAKEDLLLAIDQKGISREIAALLGRVEFAIGNSEAAINSLSVAISLGANDDKLFLERGSSYQKLGFKENACKDWNSAAKLGNSTASTNINKYCNGNTIDNQPTEAPATKLEPNNKDNGPSVNREPQIVTAPDTLVASNDKMPPADDKANEIIIDEDLSIAIFGQGLGGRKVLDRPSILILNETDGNVAIEICVNENGRVISADFAPNKSTINNKSLVELSIRKSKEFWFEKSDYPKQSGYIVYKIKGTK